MRVCVCFFKRPKFCLINRMWPIAGGRESELSKCIFTVTHCFTLAPASKLSWLLQWSQKRSDSLLSDTLTALEVSLPAFNPAFPSAPLIQNIPFCLHYYGIITILSSSLSSSASHSRCCLALFVHYILISSPLSGTADSDRQNICLYSI